MQCIHCQSDLLLSPSKDGFCPKCSTYYDQQTVKEIEELEMLNADMDIYRNVMRFKGRE